jgi:uncharacterized iron-regulated protein
MIMRWNSTRLIVLLLAVLSVPALAQEHGAEITGPIHYRVYDANGNESSLNAVISRALESDVVLVGEEHNDPLAHYLQAQLLKELVERSGDRPLALSLEMFERDVQHVVDEYLEDEISESHFKKSGRAWSNYDTDYKPLIEAAREAGIPVIAANAPRRYVNRVSREGAESLESLSELALSWLAPVPYEGPSEEYAAQWNAMMAEQMAEMQSAANDVDAEQSDDSDAGMGEGHTCEHCQHSGMHGDSTGTMSHKEGGGMHGMKAMHDKMKMHGDSTGTSSGMCVHCKGMKGDSTSAHPKMGAMHGMKAMHDKMKMHGDSTGTSSGMCVHCKGTKGDSTSAHPKMGAMHGKRMGSGNASTSQAAMPDDEIHRRLRPESKDADDKKPMMMTKSDEESAGAGMHAAMAGMLDAQSLWDATMAHSIATFLEDESRAIVLHAVGGFHVEYSTGIPEQLSLYRPGVKQLIIAIRSADDIAAFGEKDQGRGDFVILTDAELPRSYETRTD